MNVIVKRSFETALVNWLRRHKQDLRFTYMITQLDCTHAQAWAHCVRRIRHG